jgi:hypothetical protein
LSFTVRLRIVTNRHDRFVDPFLIIMQTGSVRASRPGAPTSIRIKRRTFYTAPIGGILRGP